MPQPEHKAAFIPQPGYQVTGFGAIQPEESPVDYTPPVENVPDPTPIATEGE
jgi:hypothetical protein